MKHFEVVHERGHYSVYCNGEVYCTASTRAEAEREKREAEKEDAETED